jgi:ABC-type sugar transport system permease subunit
MGDMDSPLLGKNSNFNETLTNIDEDEELEIPYTEENCVTYRFIPRENEFNFSSQNSSGLEIINGKISEEDFAVDQKALNHKSSLNSPSFILKFVVTLIFIVLIMIIGVILLIIWSMLILDPIFFGSSIYLIRKAVVILWVIREQIIESFYFTGLQKVVKRLNKKYSQFGLEWKLGPNKRWLQLANK